MACALLPLGTAAWSEPPIPSSPDVSKNSYQKDLALCRLYPAAGERIALTMAGIPPSMVLPPALKILLSSSGNTLATGNLFRPSPALKKLLRDPMLKLALQTCFPNDPALQQQFLSGLGEMDALGKAAVAIPLGVGLGYVFAYLGQAGLWIGRLAIAVVGTNLAYKLTQDAQVFWLDREPDPCNSVADKTNPVLTSLSKEVQELQTLVDSRRDYPHRDRDQRILRSLVARRNELCNEASTASLNTTTAPRIQLQN